MSAFNVYVGETKRVKTPKQAKKETDCVKLAIRSDHPRRRRRNLMLHVGGSLGVVLNFKFCENHLRVFGVPEGQKSPFSITLAGHFYNSLNYCTSRDVQIIIVYIS